MQLDEQKRRSSRLGSQFEKGCAWEVEVCEKNKKFLTNRPYKYLRVRYFEDLQITPLNSLKCYKPVNKLLTNRYKGDSQTATQKNYQNNPRQIPTMQKQGAQIISYHNKKKPTKCTEHIMKSN